MKNEDFKFRVFVTLARLHSFTRTAEELNVSQPAVSQNISELERYYGVNLVTRDRGGVYLTDEGQDFLPYARNILVAYSAAASFSTSFASSAIPQSSVGTASTVNTPSSTINTASSAALQPAGSLSAGSTNPGLTRSGLTRSGLTRSGSMSASSISAGSTRSASAGADASIPRRPDTVDGKSAARTLISGIIPGVRLLDSELADKLGEILSSEL